MADSLRNLFWTTRGFFSELASGVGDMNNFKVNSFTMDLLFSLLLMSDFAVATSVQLVLLQYHFLPSVLWPGFSWGLYRAPLVFPVCCRRSKISSPPRSFHTLYCRASRWLYILIICVAYTAFWPRTVKLFLCNTWRCQRSMKAWNKMTKSCLRPQSTLNATEGQLRTRF